MRTSSGYTVNSVSGLRKSGILPDSADGLPAGRVMRQARNPPAESVKMTDCRPGRRAPGDDEQACCLTSAF